MMMAYKRKQRRWIQGHIQVARKILGAIRRSSQFTLPQKVGVYPSLAPPLDLGVLVGSLDSPLGGLWMPSTKPT
jgi:hypothetical protein